MARPFARATTANADIAREWASGSEKHAAQGIFKGGGTARRRCKQDSLLLRRWQVRADSARIPAVAAPAADVAPILSSRPAHLSQDPDTDSGARMDTSRYIIVEQQVSGM